MLRPATPLTVLLGAAFVLLLLSVISAPIVGSIPIARAEGISFGVFGWCKDGGPCSDIKVGYSKDNLPWDSATAPSFNLKNSTKLSTLLIVHPIAAFMCLILLVLAILAHWHGPSHSPRYLLALLILTLPTLLITLLAFLVDILVFIPFVSWAGWLVLASTILIVVSGITLCAMRRTLVSRKARRKRIQENAEMSGENFYNRQREQEAKMAAMPSISLESKQPLVNSSPGSNDLPGPAAYATEHNRNDDSHSDLMGRPVSPINDENRYYASTALNGTNPHHTPQPQNQHPVGLPSDPRPSPEARGYPPNAFPRGRGGFVRGRGGPPRGGYGPGPGGRGGFRGPPPPQGFNGRAGPGNYPARGRGAPMMGPMGGPAMGPPSGMAMMPGPNRRPPPGYLPPEQRLHDIPGPDGEMGYDPISPTNYGPGPNQPMTYLPYNASRRPLADGRTSPYRDHRQSTDADGYARAESPPPDIPIGHAVAMDASTGRPSDSSHSHDLVRGRPSSERQQSREAYVPARAEWNANQTNAIPRAPSQQARTRGSSIASNGSKYYEDVDPRFAEAPEPAPALPNQDIATGPVPHHTKSSFIPQHDDMGDPLPKSDFLDDIPPGAMSPTGLSETSHYTSVSQRPVNPRWNGQPSEFNNFGPPRRPVASSQRQDMILSNNPDFSVGPVGPPRSAGRNRGGSMSMRGAPPRVPATSVDLGGDSRYPAPAVLTSREI